MNNQGKAANGNTDSNGGQLAKTNKVTDKPLSSNLILKNANGVTPVVGEKLPKDPNATRNTLKVRTGAKQIQSQN